MHLLISFFLLLVFPFRQEDVLICKSGTAYAYHNHYCRGLKECTHVVERITLHEALAQHRKPCSYCYKAVSPAASPSSLPAQPTAAGQCKGITRAGKRCSRKAGANGYCYQHG